MLEAKLIEQLLEGIARQHEIFSLAFDKVLSGVPHEQTRLNDEQFALLFEKKVEENPYYSAALGDPWVTNGKEILDRYLWVKKKQLIKARMAEWRRTTDA